MLTNIGRWMSRRGCQIICVSGLLSERLFDYEYDD